MADYLIGYAKQKLMIGCELVDFDHPKAHLDLFATNVAAARRCA